MEPLVRTLAHASGWVLLGLILAVLLQFATLIVLLRRMREDRARWRRIATGAVEMDLPTILEASARERETLLALHEGDQGRLARLEDGLAATKGRIGLVRYDAFPDVRGENSFSVAVLNEAGDGVVLTSIVGREEGRVYGKGIIDGRSDRALSDEEQRAIAAAGAGPNRPASARVR